MTRATIHHADPVMFHLEHINRYESQKNMEEVENITNQVEDQKVHDIKKTAWTGIDKTCILENISF